MKAYINRKVVVGPWGGGNLFTRAYWKHCEESAGFELCRGSSFQIRPDVMLLVGLDNQGPDEISVEQAIMYKMYVNPGCKLVLRVNENDPRKGTSHVDAGLLKLSEHVDGTVFVSKWMQQYFNEKGWACKNQTVIINGVDNQIFKPGTKLNNGKLNIVAHHWSDNWLKGGDVYEQIDRFVGENPDRFTFTYIGRHKCDFKHTNVVKPLSGKLLGEELGKYDVYVSASRFDPGPNHVLEALACGLSTYVHHDGGGCVEFATGAASYRDWNFLRALLVCEHAAGQVREPTVNTFTPGTWQECVREYNAFLASTWQT